MSLLVRVFKETSWLATFKTISQIFTWCVTLVVARILSPEDYGLMALATIVVGYGQMFSELGLGAAIIQKEHTTEEELSSVFWVGLAISILVFLLCFLSAYPAAVIFDDKRIIPITQAVSVIFILTGINIVPLNLLKKELEFKKVGLIEMVSSFGHGATTLLIATLGGGVWALVGGILCRQVIKSTYIYVVVKWLPLKYFNWHGIRSHIRFGVTLSISHSFWYIYEVTDKVIAGKVWTAKVLGYYSFALNLAKLPVDKIVTLINQVSFPLLSKFQNSPEEFNNVYLRIVKSTALVVTPLFFGGYIVGEELVKVLLTEKWYPMIFVFKYLCLAQFLTVLSALTNRVHISQGRPTWNLCYHVISAVVMGISFYFAVQYGLNAIIIPWYTSYLVLCSVWVIVTLRKMGISVQRYIMALRTPVIGSLIMGAGIVAYNNIMPEVLKSNVYDVPNLVTRIIMGGLFYLAFVYVFDRKVFGILGKLRVG